MFLRNCPQDLKALLIRRSLALIYTPTNEHFGIVPLEAMALRRPVIADQSGGPMETVIPGENGFLCTTWDAYGEAMATLVEKPHLDETLGMNGCESVEKKFSFQAFGDQLDDCVRKMISVFKPQLYLPFLFLLVFVATMMWSPVCTNRLP